MESLPVELMEIVIDNVHFGSKNWLNVLLTCKFWCSIGKRVFDPSIRNNRAIRWASENGRTNCVKLLLSDSRVNPGDVWNSAIRSAAYEGHLEIVIELLKDSRVDPRALCNYALNWACSRGHLEVVKELFNDCRVDTKSKDQAFSYSVSHPKVMNFLLQFPSVVDPATNDNAAIQAACEHNLIQSAKLLLADPRVDPSVQDNFPIRKASENGHQEIVKMLLSHRRVDPSVDDNYALRMAAKNGHKKVVKILLADARVDPSSENNTALRVAAECGHKKVVELLVNDHRMDQHIRTPSFLKAVEKKDLRLVYSKLDDLKSIKKRHVIQGTGR